MEKNVSPEDIKKLEKRIKKLEDQIKYIDANLKINYILPIVTLSVFLLVKVIGNFKLLGFIITPLSASSIISALLLIAFSKELIFAVKYTSKRFINVVS